MPRQRLQVDVGLRPEPLRPAAAPVDTFVRPSAGQSLLQLAQGLSTMAPSLGQFAQVYGAKTNEEQRAKGEAEARRLQEEGKTLAQAVKEGLIPRTANPFFLAGFREQFGRVTADRMQEDLTAALATNDEMKTTTDLSKYDAFVQDFRKKWMEENVGKDGRDQFFEAGFGGRADTYTAQMRRSFAGDIARRIETQSDEAHLAEVKKHVTDNIGMTTPETIAADIDRLNRDMIAQGRDGGQVNRTTVQAIKLAALEMAQAGNPMALDVLGLLKKVKAGSGVVGDTSYGSATFIETTSQVSMLLKQENQRVLAEFAQEREDRIRTTLADATRDLASNPNANLTKYINAVADDPQAVDQLTSLQSSVGRLTYRTDEEVKRDLFSRIWSPSGAPVTARSVITAMNRGALNSGDAYWLISQIEARDNAQKSGSDIFNDFSFRRALSSFSDRFRDPVNGFVAGETGDRVAFAEAMLTSRWIKLHQSGQADKMSEDERVQWLTKQATDIVQYERGESFFTNSPAVAPQFGDSTSQSTPAGKTPQPQPEPQPPTADEMNRLMDDMLGDSLSTASQALLKRQHITTTAQLTAFIRAYLKPSSDSTSHNSK